MASTKTKRKRSGDDDEDKILKALGDSAARLEEFFDGVLIVAGPTQDHYYPRCERGVSGAHIGCYEAARNWINPAMPGYALDAQDGPVVEEVKRLEKLLPIVQIFVVATLADGRPAVSCAGRGHVLTRIGVVRWQIAERDMDLLGGASF